MMSIEWSTSSGARYANRVQVVCATPARGVAVGRRKPRPYWDALLADTRAKQPHFFAAVVADAKITAAAHGDRSEFRGRADAVCQALRLAWTSDAFLAQLFYRAQARLEALGVPVLPRVAHRLAMMTGQVCIGRTVVMHPGVHLGHGQVVVDGFVEIHPGVVILPWVTIGLRDGHFRGPTIGRDVRIGTGAKVLGPITVHRGARIGANAVVIDDVPARATVVGVPARVVGEADLP
jgi:serine O-acetyltransferase